MFSWCNPASCSQGAGHTGVKTENSLALEPTSNHGVKVHSISNSKMQQNEKRFQNYTVDSTERKTITPSEAANIILRPREQLVQTSPDNPRKTHL